MASLPAQVSVNPTEYLFLTKSDTIIQGSVRVVNGQETATFGAEFNAAYITSATSSLPPSVTALTIQADGNTTLDKNGTVFFETTPTFSSVNNALFIGYPLRGTYLKESVVNGQATILYDPTLYNAGIPSEIDFLDNGVIRTSDSVAIGTTAVAKLTVGITTLPTNHCALITNSGFGFQDNGTKLLQGGMAIVGSSVYLGTGNTLNTTGALKIDAANNVTNNGTLTNKGNVTVGSSTNTLLMTPTQYLFQSSSIANGGMIVIGPNVAIGTGTDPGNSGLGIVMSPTQLGFRKPIDAVAGISISAVGNINTSQTVNAGALTAGLVGISTTGPVSAGAGGFTTTGGLSTYGTIQSMTSSDNVGGKVRLINGDFSLFMISQGDGHAPGGIGGTIYSTNDGAGGSISTTTFIPGAGCQIDGGTGTMNLTASAVINLNAPIVYYNNQPVPRMYTWSYSTTTAEQQIYAGSGGAPGSFVRFPNNGVAQPRIANPISLNHDYWYAPYTGVYLITFSITGHNLNTGSSATYISLFVNNVVPLGTAVATFGNGIYTTQSSTSYQTLTAGDSLLVAGLNGDGGQVYLYGGCVWTITLVNTLT